MRPIDTQRLSLQALAGHGHVKPRPDGAVMRCGGPAICRVCQHEKAQLEMSQRMESALHPLNGQHINQGSMDAAADAYERDYLQAKIDTQAIEIERLRAEAEHYDSAVAARDLEIQCLREALKLALEYWADRQQRYKNRSPVWVQKARAALAQEQS